MMDAASFQLFFWKELGRTWKNMEELKNMFFFSFFGRPGPYELNVQYTTCESEELQEVAGPAWQLVVPGLHIHNG